MKEAHWCHLAAKVEDVYSLLWPPAEPPGQREVALDADAVQAQPRATLAVVCRQLSGLTTVLHQGAGSSKAPLTTSMSPCTIGLGM